MARQVKAKTRWPGPSKNKKQMETRKKPVPMELMNIYPKKLLY